MLAEIEPSLTLLSDLNPGFKKNRETNTKPRNGKLQKVLIANRGEIAKRFFLSLREEGIPSVAIVTDVDLGQSWYEFADEFIRIGDISNYTNIPLVVASAILSKANAIYPGYGFLSENPLFVKTIKEASASFGHEMIFMGPDDSVMNKVGEKLAARALAKEFGVPLFEGSEAIDDLTQAKKIAEKIGYPIIVKLSNGGGGKGMMPVFQESGLFYAIESAKRIGKSLYNDDTYYIEKYITKPVHMEVQIFNGTAIGIRKCAVQRRNQKVIEETGDEFINDYTTLSLLAAAENMARISGYADGCGAGTVEFLYDQDSGNIGFLEMNTRLQVEHPVTDQSLGIDLAKWQIYQFDGCESKIDYKTVLEKRFTQKDHAIECRIYAEDPESGYTPSPGIIQDIELPTFNGTRCDFGFRKGDTILPHYDPMIGKVITRGTTREIAIARMERALSELYIKGLTTNVNQLLLIIRDPDFQKGDYSNRLLDDRSYLEKSKVHESDAILTSTFASLCEYAKRAKQKARDSFISGDMELSVYNSGTTKLPTEFQVETGDFKNKIQLIQTGIHSFHVFLNENHLGEAQITSKPAADDDYLIRFGLRSYSVRIDNRPNFTVLRIKNTKNKISYFRVKITAEGLGDKVDPPGMVRAPFQGSFVKFARDEQAKRDRLTVGSSIKKGDPIIIISAMKMETVITAPLTGKILHLVEDGDMSKLQIGETPQGQIIGKNIPEGEILFIIEGDANASEAEVAESKKQSRVSITKPVSQFSEQLEALVQGKNDSADLGNIPVSLHLSLLESYFLGFAYDDKILATTLQYIRSLKGIEFTSDERESFETEVRKILGIYSLVKKIYAPSVGKNISIFNELNEYLKNWNNESFSPSLNFKYTMDSLFRYYDVQKWLGITENQPTEVEIAIFFMQRAYHHISQNTEALSYLLDLLEIVSPNGIQKKTSTILRKLYSLEEAEKDDTKAERIKKTLHRYKVPVEVEVEKKPISRKYFNEFKIFMDDSYAYYEPNPSERENYKKKLLAAFQANLELVPKSNNPKDWFYNQIAGKLEKIQENFSVTRLDSRIGDLLIYALDSKTDPSDKRYLLFYYTGKMDEDRDANNRINGSRNSEKATIEAAFLLKNYQLLAPRSNNQIEILANQEPITVDLGSNRKDIFNFDNLFQVNLNVNHFLKDLNVTKMIVHILCQSPFGGAPTEKLFQLSVKNGMIVPDLVLKSDTRNVYFEKPANTATMRMLERDKWPIEFWANECFLPESLEEITIPSVDQILWTNPKTNKEEYKPVGGKIYLGKLGETHAIFYMKDSRINGGATGDLEGLKYLATLFLGYRWQIPVYIWNDGAGANIKEGMVSLNRAGQGFMMNSLLTSQASLDKFNKFTLQNPDPRLRDLFQELDRDFVAKSQALISSRSVLVAVGIGSSTGLDVYGSSQTAIQVMVDMDESYRVLTGSNVIKSVMGEDFTNYQIGGAKVMGKWTGTVDMVADNKIHLISILRRIQGLFYPNFATTDIKPIEQRPTANALGSGASKVIEDSFEEKRPGEVISESELKKNLDGGEFLPFKEKYYGSGSLLGGFGRLNQSPVCIMGARTNYGIRSFATVTRAKELSMIASKTGSDRILIFGRRWFYQFMHNDAPTIQARKDFLNQYGSGDGMNIHIVTEVGGLERAPIHSFSDLIILAKEGELSKEDYQFASKSATFLCANLTEAFQLSGKILEYINFPESRPAHLSGQPIESNLVPEIPKDPAQPFDMVEMVIQRTFDQGSFIEFFREMNDPMNGPCLVTGLAKLNNETVGVIADQPNIMGGAPDAPGTEKYRVFTEFLNRFNIPIVMLSNAPGFYPGTKQERLRIQQIGAESLDANILGEVPVVSVVLNQNFGGRQIHAFSRAIRPGIVYLALKTSVMAVMGGSASFDLFMGAKYNELLQEGKKEEAIALKDKYLKDYNEKASASNDAYKTGVLDGLLSDVSELRKALLDGLIEAKKRGVEYFGWKRKG